jgi:protein-disulfide isomerase
MEERSSNLTTLVLFLIVGLVLGGVIGFLYGRITAPTQVIEGVVPQQTLKPSVPRETVAPATQKNIDMKSLIDDDPWAGNKNAKVIVVEFSDFQCPFCQKAAPTVKQIIESYGDNILFVYRDFPIHSIHPQAQKAAEASQCAFEQDRFWDYHDKLFEKQSEWGISGVPKFKDYATELGLDTTKFNDCLDSGKYANEVGADLSVGQQLGVTGTPTFFVNGEKVVGAQPYSIFEGIIDNALA